MLILIGISWQVYPNRISSSPVYTLPLKGIGFQGSDVPLSASERAYYGEANVVKRLYSGRASQFMLTIIDGTRNRHAVHDPAYCFQGMGWRIAAREELALGAGTAVRLRMQKGVETQEAIYWFSEGDAHYTSPLRYWWRTALRRLTLGVAGKEPVLVVIQPVTPSALRWSILARMFTPLETL